MIDSFVLQTEQFEGPLEVLLNLIEERKLSISEVNLANVCDAYLAHIERLPGMPLGETSQFILIASTLLLIKSRSLLPLLSLSEEERESVDELERRLARLALIKKASRLVKNQWGVRPLALSQSVPQRPVIFSPREASVTTIRSAALTILRTLPVAANLAEASVAPIRALEDVIVEVRNRLKRAIRASFRELSRSANREERIIYFLAMLELVRSGGASVTQERLFADITIEWEEAGIPQFGV
jgi:segregation and condensation protein A